MDTVSDHLMAWIWAASASNDQTKGEFTLSTFTEEELDTLVADMVGILESCQAITKSMELLVGSQPSPDTLETHLIEYEVDLQHAQWHWRSITRALRGKDLYMEDDLRMSDE